MSMARFGWHVAAHPKALYLQLQLESALPTEFAWVVWWPSG